MEKDKVKNTAKVSNKPKKKKKKLSSQQLIKIISLVLIVVFVLGIASTSLFYFVYSLQNRNSNIVDYGNLEYYSRMAAQYEEALKNDPNNTEYIFTLIGIYQEMGVQAKSAQNMESSKTYFKKAIALAEKVRELSPEMATSFNYTIAGIYIDMGEYDLAEAILLDIINGGLDLIKSRLAYAQFLIENRNNKEKAAEQIQLARGSALTDSDQEYINQFVQKCNLQ